METIATVEDQTVVVSTEANNTVIVGDVLNPATIIVTGQMGPPGRTSGITDISSATDIDITNLQNGSLLAYSESTSKWVATTTLTSQTLECGQF